MPTLQIEINIADEPGTGHARNKLNRLDRGSDDGSILSRIVAANHATYGTVRRDSDVNTIIQSLIAAVQQQVVEAHTAGDTLTAEESGSVHTNTGAAGTITLVLPAATVGLQFRFRVGVAQELRLDPNGSETIALPSTGVQGAAGKYLVADAIDDSVYLFCAVAGTWSVVSYTGTWTAEG